MEQPIKLVITGGGTAGHVIPALAVGEALKEKGCTILYIGSYGGIEKDFLAKSDIPFKSIYCGKLRRYWSFWNLIDPFKILIGILQSIWIILRFKPAVIFAKGGYVSFPVVVAGWLLKKPILLHESDFHLGLSNRITLRLAARIAVSFPVENYPHLPAHKIIYTGNPLRKEIFYSSREKGKVYFQLRNDLPTILIVGGSQGARKINQTLKQILNELLMHSQVIHITGKLDFENFKLFKGSLPQNLKINYKVYPFLRETFLDALAVADLIISRGGANTIFEAGFYKKPLIIIPLAGHQEKNAAFFEKHNAAYMIRDKDLTPKMLLKAIKYLLENPEESRLLAKNLHSFVIPEATNILSQEIIKLAFRRSSE